jgi:cellulase/cellobiase CelA1
VVKKTKTSRPPSKPAPKPTTTKPAPAAAFSARYTMGESWDQGFIGTVAVTNRNGPAVPAAPWTVRLTFAPSARVQVGNTWNARLSRDGDTFVFTGDQLAPGATVTLGFQASKQVRPRVQPATCTVNGAPCRIG